MGTKRTVVLVLFLALVSAVTSFAQSNETIDQILGQDPATTGSAAYVALTAAGLLDDASTPAKAIAMAKEAGWLPPEAAANDSATFGVLTHLLMQAFESPGGLMYRISPGPRYAAREFVYQGWSPVRVAPNDLITGEFLLQVTGSFLESQEGAQ